MRKIGILMSILMGFSMSLILSLVGTLMGGHFTVPSWLISFGISFVISLIIGFIVPMKVVSDKACNGLKINPQSFKGNLLSSLISDLIYTPIITVTMVCIMVTNAKKQLAARGIPGGPTILGELWPSLIVCLLVGFVVIAIIQPLFLKLLTRNLGKKPE